MTGEAASANWERANDFPDAIKKLIDEKGYLLEQIFNADENALVLKKKNAIKDFYEEGREAHTKIKSGRDRLTLLFCVNEIRFMIRTAIIYKAANQGI